LDGGFNEGGSKEDDIVQCVELINLYTKYCIIVHQKKCYFGLFELPALGYIAGGNGRRMNPSKCKAIVKWLPPSTGNEMQRFLGTVNFNRPHLPRFAHACKPLDEQRYTNKIEWNPDLDKAFNEVKASVKMNLSLVSRNTAARLCIATDASSLGLGYILAPVKPLKDEQIKQGHLEVIEYESVAIKNNLAHGSATKREIVAVIFAFKKCYSYLAATDFLIFTDHQALV
jgi:RNase H-like domain found in reverse transcriptase